MECVAAPIRSHGYFGPGLAVAAPDSGALEAPSFFLDANAAVLARPRRIEQSEGFSVRPGASAAPPQRVVDGLPAHPKDFAHLCKSQAFIVMETSRFGAVEEYGHGRHRVSGWKGSAEGVGPGRCAWPRSGPPPHGHQPLAPPIADGSGTKARAQQLEPGRRQTDRAWPST